MAISAGFQPSLHTWVIHTQDPGSSCETLTKTKLTGKKVGDPPTTDKSLPAQQKPEMQGGGQHGWMP